MDIFYCLSIYSNNFTKNIYLPILINGKHTVTVYKSESKLNSDFNLELEVKNGEWTAVSSKLNTITFNNSPMSSIQLSGNLIFNCVGKFGNIAVVVSQIDYGMINYSKFLLPQGYQVIIGRDDSCTIVCKNNLVSKQQAMIQYQGNQCIIQASNSSKNGVYVNGVAIQQANLKPGDIISFSNIQLIYLNGVIAVNNPGGCVSCKLSEYRPVTANHPDPDTLPVDEYFTISPRLNRKPDREGLEIDPPPEPEQYDETPLSHVIGPSLTMAIGMVFMAIVSYTSSNGLMRYSSGIMALSMLICAVLWPIVSGNHRKKVAEQKEALRQKRYNEYINDCDVQMAQKVNHNRSVLNEISPPLTEVSEYAHNRARRLWERSISDRDFLNIRLGLGKQHFDVPVSTSKKHFHVIEDELRDLPDKIRNRYKIIDNVPVHIDLKNDVSIGIIGDSSNILSTLHTMIMQITALHSYEDVKTAFIFNQNDAEYFEWVKYLPHSWTTDNSFRFVASSKDEVHELLSHLANVVRERVEAAAENEDTSAPPVIKPYYILFIADEKLAEDNPALEYITSNMSTGGIIGVFAYRKIRNLPLHCRTIIQHDKDSYIYYSKTDSEGELIDIIPDQYNNGILKQYAKELANINVKTESSTGVLPSNLSFLAMLSAGRVEQLDAYKLWNESTPHKSLAAPIGVLSDGSIFSLDIHEKYHGPHGLIAGMTGSGKSEFIQTFILSLALKYHPDDLSFILIDYKGGGMANYFLDLPHLSGTITNLGGNQIRRSLISINAELKRRQRYFSQYGVNHIDKYQKLYKEGKCDTPISHLVIISDEFAELKAQQPEFMQELVSTARIGRSLGVHLILATQKPSGIVDDQIWSNTTFRVCLKVMDKLDSQEMLKRPEASTIVLPGRCYVQVGYNELFEEVQSAYSGEEYVPSDEVIDVNKRTVSLIDNCALPMRTAYLKTNSVKTDTTHLEATVNYLNEVGKEHNVHAFRLWLDPLANIIDLLKIKGYSETLQDSNSLKAIVGMVDDPANQAQFPLTVDIAQFGHMVLFAAPGMGKSTFLQTMLYSLTMTYSPEDVNYYILDFSARVMGYFLNAPHCGDVFYSDNEDKIAKFIEMMETELEDRKKKFADYNIGNITSYKAASNKKMANLLIVIDNITSFSELYEEYEDFLVRVCREGANYGIYLITTCTNTNSIKYRIMQNMKHFYTLSLNDRFEYINILGPTDGFYPEALPGRGLYKIDKSVVEFQTAIVGGIEDEALRVEFMLEKFKEVSAKFPEYKAMHVPVVPDIVTYESITENTENYLAENKLPIGFDKESADIFTVDFNKHNSFFITGAPTTGKTNLIKHCIKFYAENGYKIYLADDSSGSLAKYSSGFDSISYMKTEEEIDNCAREILKTVRERWEDLVSFRESSSEMSDEEYMSKYDKIVIVIHSFTHFFDTVSEKALQVFEATVKRSSAVGIFFITAENHKMLKEYTDEEIYEYLINPNNGILLGGNVNAQTILNPATMRYTQRDEVLEPGKGVYVGNNGYNIIITPEIK